MKIEFENEQKIRDFLKDTMHCKCDVNGVCFDCITENAKSKGYIKKSDLEKAKERHYNTEVDSPSSWRNATVYIDELEKEIEILKRVK